MALTYEGITTQYIREIAQRPRRRPGGRRAESARTQTARPHTSGARSERRRASA